MPASLRHAVALVALLNLSYFGVEFGMALCVSSVSLFADSIDFLEDALVNGLILIALGWSVRARAVVGVGLAALLLMPGIATLWTAWHKLMLPVAPDPIPLSLTALGALAVNLFCAFVLARFRHHAGSLSRAAFLSARNDALANIAMIAVAGLTALWPTAWPDLVVGLCIALINAASARAVLSAAKSEYRSDPVA
jgi:Co/Zn/Cd efflux system component